MRALNKNLINYLLTEGDVLPGMGIDERLALFIQSSVDYINVAISLWKDWSDFPDDLKAVFQNNENHFNFLTMSDEDYWNWLHCVDGCPECETMDPDCLNVVIQWPESQDLIGVSDQYQATLINDELGLQVYGSSAYILPKCMMSYFEHDMASLSSEEKSNV